MFVRLSVLQRSLWLNSVNLSNNKKKELDGDQKAIQQLEFYRMLDTSSQVCTILEKLKQTVLEFYKGRTKVLWEYINGYIQ